MTTEHKAARRMLSLLGLASDLANASLLDVFQPHDAHQYLERVREFEP